MFLISRKHSPARWPFWLLVAAWFCANSPQAVTYELVVWLGSARHFAHQERLHADVAFLLAGRDAPALLASVKAVPPRPFSPPVPADATLKKIELATPVVAEFLPPARRGLVHLERAFTPRGLLRAPPPHGPPRATFLA